MSTQGSGASRGGGDEFHNEDAFLAKEGLGLYVVSDGASQRPAGEVAASIATRALEAFVERAKIDCANETRVKDTSIAVQGMHHAFEAIRAAEADEPGRHGMSASVTMLLTDGHRGVIGHRGDSRAYLIRRRRARQLTRDQELTDEVEGGTRDTEIQVFWLDLEPGDTLVLCTDGAENVVEDPEIERVAGDLAPAVLASRIVSKANRRTPDHDATAVVVRVHGEHEGGWLELSGPPEGTAFGHTLPPRQSAGGSRD